MADYQPQPHQAPTLDLFSLAQSTPSLFFLLLSPQSLYSTLKNGCPRNSDARCPLFIKSHESKEHCDHIHLVRPLQLRESSLDLCSTSVEGNQKQTAN